LTGNKMHVETAADLHIKSNSDAHIEAVAELNLSGDTSYFYGDAEAHVRGAGELFLGSAGNINLKAGGNIDADGSNINLNSGGAKRAATAAPAAAATLATPNPLPTIPQGKPIRPPSLGLDVTCGQPVTYQQEVYHYETEDDFDSPGAKAMRQQNVAQQGLQNSYAGDPTPYDPVDGGNLVTPTGGGGNVTAVDTSEIANMPPHMFTANYRLSTHFNLGMMFDGGFNKTHKLQPQNGLTVNQIVANLANLCQNILEPLIEKDVLPGGIQGLGKQWKINSGYRMGEQRGKRKRVSQHNLGQAVDFGLFYVPNRHQKTLELIKEVEKVIPYDQLIFEYNGPQVWIHCSFNINEQRKDAFTLNAKTEQRYSGFRWLT